MSSIFDRPSRKPTGSWWRDHSLSITITLIWAACSVITYITYYHGRFVPGRAESN